MRDNEPQLRPSKATNATLSPSAERVDAALLQLARLLGRQAARDALRSEAPGAEETSSPNSKVPDHD